MSTKQTPKSVEAITLDESRGRELSDAELDGVAGGVKEAGRRRPKQAPIDPVVDDLMGDPSDGLGGGSNNGN